MRHATRWMVFEMVILACLAGRGVAGPLNPLDFPLIGTGAFPTASGTYTFNTSGTPTLIGPGGTLLIGVVADGVAVFNFDSIAVASGQVFIGEGSRPLALLSRGDINVAGTIDVGASDGRPGPGGFGPGDGPGAGGRGTFATYSPPVVGPPSVSLIGGGGGGGFGGTGGAGGAGSIEFSPVTAAGGAGGETYGDLSRLLQGGGGGGDSLGGGGGGAIELGAVGTISISGRILASGGDALVSRPAALGGGGGAGGGIFLHGSGVILSGTLGAIGGGGAPGGTDGRGFPGSITVAGRGGNGGGGRILIQAGPGGFANRGGIIDASNGTITIVAVPEPSGLFLVGTGLLAPMGAWWLRLRHAAGEPPPSQPE